jgi:nucleotide-binding universal stress UspA family protein
VGRAHGHEHKGARATLHHAVADAQRQLSFEDVKDLLDLGVVMSARIEARGGREYEHGAAFGVLGSHEEIYLRPRFRGRLGPPKPLDEHLGRIFTGQYLLPFQRYELPEEIFGIGRILVPLDGSALAEHALPIAELLARTTGGSLALMSVCPQHSAKLVQNDLAPEPTIETYLDRMEWMLRQGGLIVETSIRSGSIPEEIGHHAIASNADIIVMGTHGRTHMDRFLSRNIATAVVRQTERPVLLIRPTDVWTSRHTTFRKLLVCLDGSVESEEVLPWARIIARYFGSTIVLLTVPEAEGEVQRLKQYIESVAAALRSIGITAETRVTGSGASRTITSVAESDACDLIMIATRGRGAPKEIDIEVGSVTDQIVQTAHCPVFAVTVLGFANGAK